MELFKKAKVFDDKIKILSSEIQREIDKIKISPSKVSAWLSSPGDFIMNCYFEKDVAVEETIHLVRGNWFHSIMEDFYSKSQENRNVASLKESAKRVTEQKYKELSLNEENKTWLNVALNNYYKKWGKDASKDKVASLFINGKQSIGLELFVNGKIGNTQRQCLGFIDRIIEGERGIRVEDWKTGKTINTFDPSKKVSSSNSFDYWRQQIFYTLLLEAKGLKVEEASLLFPCTDPPEKVIVDIHLREAREQTIKDIEQFDKELQESIDNDYTFQFKKGPYNGWATFLCGLGKAKKPNIFEDKLFDMLDIEV